MDAITKLRQERAALAARLHQIDNILEKSDELQRLAMRLLPANYESLPTADSPEEVLSDSVKQVAVTEDTKPNAAKGKPSLASKTPMDIFEANVVDLLKQTDIPLDRADLYSQLVTRGVVIGSAGPKADLNALSARMSRMDGVVNIRGFGYWLVSRDFEPGGYTAKHGGSGQRDDGRQLSTPISTLLEL